MMHANGMPDQTLLDIFSWLPAKAIYKFKTVARLCLDFPEDDYFTKKQAQNAWRKDDSCFFLQNDFRQNYNGHTELHDLPGHESSSGLSSDVLEFLANSTKILTSSNGLLLCRTINHHHLDFFISNPVTTSCFHVPTLGLEDVPIDANQNIIFDCNSNDYKLFLLEPNLDDWCSMNCKVYQPKEGSWETKKETFFIGGRNLIFDMPVHHIGAFHFISDSSAYFDKRSCYFRPYIMAFDFDNGSSRMLRVPKEARRGSHDDTCKMRIFKWGKATSSTQSICLVRFRKSVFTVWIMTDYEFNSWRKILKVRVKAMGLAEKDPVVKGFTILNGDVLVLATQEKVYTYGLSNEKYMNVEQVGEHKCEFNVCFTSYSNTLRSCGIESTPLDLHHCITESAPLPLPSCNTDATLSK